MLLERLQMKSENLLLPWPLWLHCRFLCACCSFVQFAHRLGSFQVHEYSLFKKSLCLLGNKLHPLVKTSESSLREYEFPNVFLLFCHQKKTQQQERARRYKGKEWWGQTAAACWAKSSKMTHVERGREGRKAGREDGGREMEFGRETWRQADID